MNVIKEIFILFVLISMFYASCPTGSAVVEAPAVIGEDKGGLLKIYVDVEEGNGNVYTSVNPKVGVSTQSSEYTATKVAFDRAGYDLNECNVYFTIPSKGRYIDGPSAGALFTCAVYSAITNKTMRNDVTITGTIDNDGEIGSVGGLAEKAAASSRFGKDYFITSITDNKNYLIISAVEEKYGITVVNVNDIDKLFDYVYSNDSLPEMNYSIAHSPTNVSDFSGDDVAEFDNIVNSLDYEILKKSKEISPSSSLLLAVVDYMINDIDYQKNISAKGYKFTAANNLFLHYTDLLFIEYLTQYDNIKDYFNVAEKELNESSNHLIEDSSHITLNNFEYATGAYMRYTWARSKIKSVGNQLNIKGDEQYSLAYNLAYARGWIRVSRLLNSISVSNGSVIDETKVEPVASEWIEQTEHLLTHSPGPSSDAIWHYSLAQEDYNNKKYIASVYECVFAQSLQRASDSNDDEINDIIEKSGGYVPQSKWAKLYYGQGEYLLKTGHNKEAYKLFILSVYFDEAYDNIYKALSSNISSNLDNSPLLPNSGNCKGQEHESEMFNMTIIISLTYIFIMAFIICFIVYTNLGQPFN